MLTLLLLSPHAWADDPPPAEGAPAAEPAAEGEPCAEGEENCATVVVSASRAAVLQKEATPPVVVIDRARIEATGATTVEDVLRTSPAVQVTHTHGGAGISLEGLDPEHTLILVDGRPIAGREEGSVDIRRIPAESIERIEILPGPASALYGSEALGGVVNIVTRKDRPDAPTVDATARVGSRKLIEGNASLVGATGAFTGGASVDRTGQDGWDEDPSDVATTGDDEAAWGTRGWGRLGLGAFTVDADAAYHLRDLQGVELIDTGAVFDHRTLEETADGAASLAWWNGARATLRGQVGGSLWRQQYLEDQQGDDTQDDYAETFDRRAFANAGWQWAPDHHLLVAGLDGNVEELESELVEDGTASRDRLGVYAQEDGRITDRWRLSVSPGARLDLDSQFGVHATPHLGLRVDPAPWCTVRLSGGQGYRAPELKELYLAFDHSAYGYRLDGNPDLRPEASWGGNAELLVTAAKTVQLRGAGYWNEVTDLIDIDLVSEGGASTPAEYIYANVGRAVTRGFEAGFSWVRPGPVSLTASYAFTDARDRETDLPLDGRPVHRVTGSFTVHTSGTTQVSSDLEWVGPRPFTLDETTWSDPYAWIDLRGAWTFHPGMELELGVRNLSDTRDELYSGLPPRTVYAGIRATGAVTARKEAP